MEDSDFRELVENAPCWIMRVDAERTITYVNRKPPAETGLQISSLEGKKVDAFIAEADRERALAVIQNALEDGEKGSYLASASPETDSSRYLVHVAPLSGGEGGRRAVLATVDLGDHG